MAAALVVGGGLWPAPRHGFCGRFGRDRLTPVERSLGAVGVQYWNRAGSARFYRVARAVVYRRRTIVGRATHQRSASGAYLCIGRPLSNVVYREGLGSSDVIRGYPASSSSV